jgi:hypothetical protein
MPVPLPGPDATDLSFPDADLVACISRGVAGAVVGVDGELTQVQHLLIEALCQSMTGHPAALAAGPLGPVTLAEALGRRNLAFRTRIVQLMVLSALVLRPLPQEVVQQVEAYSRELGVDESLLRVAERFASGSLGLAAVDFERNGYTADWSAHDAAELHTSHELATAWQEVVDDPALAGRWRALEGLPEGTLGRRITELYRARGFGYPGEPGSAPPLLAQHDWVHVLADYGTTVESELEVFGFIARANDDPRGFSLLAMVVSLFETGYLRTGAGLFESDLGHLSLPGMAARVADAMRRGAVCDGSTDFLRVDWFALADRRVDDLRDQFGIVAKSPEALDAGSVGPWERGGISPFQIASGRMAADRAGRRYESFGAEPVPR